MQREKKTLGGKGEGGKEKGSPKEEKQSHSLLANYSKSRPCACDT